MSVMDILENPPLLHAILVHFPVVLGVVGIPLVFLIALVDTERNVLRWVGVGCYVALVCCALASQVSGERARERVPNTLSAEVFELIEQHEEMAELVWIPAAATAVLLVLSVLKVRWFRKAAMLLAMLASLACAGLVSLTGHYGGTLVHHYGVSGAIMLKADGTLPDAPPAAAVVEPEDHEAEPSSEEPAPVEPTAEDAEAIDTPPPPPAAVTPPATEQPAATTEETPPMEEPAPEAAEAPVPEVSYAATVQPIFEKHCVGCHPKNKPAGDISLASASAVQRSGKKAGPGVVPGKPEESSILKYMRGELKPQMPLGKDPLPDADIEAIHNWIAGGAKDDSESAPAQ